MITQNHSERRVVPDANIINRSHSSLRLASESDVVAGKNDQLRSFGFQHAVHEIKRGLSAVRYWLGHIHCGRGRVIKMEICELEDLYPAVL